MPAITLPDLNNAKLDVDHIAAIATSTELTATDRLGQTKRTLNGQMAAVDAELAAKLDDAQSQINVKVNEAAGHASDSAASALEAYGYLQSYRATSYGALASDPATDPLGNPPTVGDEYFNTTSNLLKRWNGTTWQASDINTANLADPSGSSLIGYTTAGTGAVATTVQTVLREMVNAKRFGAIGDGVADDGPALQKFFDYLASSSFAGRMTGGTYKTNQELVISNRVDLVADVGNTPVTIKAGAAIRSVLKLKMVGGKISGITFDAARLADYAVIENGVSNSIFTQIYYSNALIDGRHGPSNDPDTNAVLINDRNTYNECSFGGSGKVYVSTGLATGTVDHENMNVVIKNYFCTAAQFVETSATASMSSGSNILTALGMAFVTVQKVRPGDTIRVGTGTNRRYYTVLQVDSETQLQTTRLADVAHTSAPFVLGVGHGFHDKRHGDNNIHIFNGGLFRFNAAAGMLMNGLYGHTMTGTQFDYHVNHAIVVGVNGGNPVISSQFNHCYIEATGGKHFYINSASNIHIIAPLDSDSNADKNIEYNTKATSIGTYTNRTGSFPIGSGFYSEIPCVAGAPVGKKFANFGGFDVSGAFVNPASPTTYDTSNPFPADYQVAVYYPSVSSTINAIAANGLSNRLLIVNVGAGTLTINATVGIHLSASSIVLSQFDTIELYRYGTSYWVEISHSNNS